MLTDGYHDVPHGKLAAVVTLLEMRQASLSKPGPPPDDLRVRRETNPSTEWYRALFRHIGSDYLWTSRLALGPAELERIIHDVAVEVYALEHEGHDEGLLELDFRSPGACELAFFGVSKTLVGRGAAAGLMAWATRRAWEHPIERFWLHTCHLDHPAALRFYQKAGFVPYARQVEVFDDPRLAGWLPRTCAPNIPLIER